MDIRYPDTRISESIFACRNPCIFFNGYPDTRLLCYISAYIVKYSAGFDLLVSVAFCSYFEIAGCYPVEFPCLFISFDVAVAGVNLLDIYIKVWPI